VHQILNSIYSNQKETPVENISEQSLKNELNLEQKKNFGKSSTFNYDINNNLFYNKNINIETSLNNKDENEVKKSKTLNENDIYKNINDNMHFNINNGHYYLETVLETLNEVSNCSEIEEQKNNNNNICINNNKNENKINEDNKDKENYMNIKINKKNKNEISDTKFQESDNNASSWMATLSGGTNTKKNIFPFK
jgi:hypothetical protein